jgi:nitrite reductase/ring-hydroxylating ferredoxin subunit
MDVNDVHPTYNGLSRRRSDSLEDDIHMPDHEFLSASRGSRIDHVGTYRRVLPTNLTRMYENALDWEHLPFVHSSSFSSIDCVDAGPWGWRAEVVNARGQRSMLELRLDKKLRRWITRNLEGPSVGAEIWTHVFERGPNELELNIDFFVPDVPEDARDKVGTAYAKAYEVLYDEDVAMMVERQRQLDRRIESRRDDQPLVVGDVDTLKLPMQVDFRGRAIVVNRIGEDFAAYPAVCPHQSGPLDQADLEQSIVRCPWHGYEFDVFTGNCVSGHSCRLSQLPVVTVSDGVLSLS